MSGSKTVNLELRRPVQSVAAALKDVAIARSAYDAMPRSVQGAIRRAFGVGSTLKVFLHVGPHKTGTTTLQAMLQGAFATPKKGHQWYPNPSGYGPGHAQLAWQVFGLNGNAETVAPLRRLVESARTAKMPALLLSSEEFARGHTSNLDALAGVFADCELTLCFTYMDIVKRATSLWQELVKHGHQKSAANSTDFVFSRCSMRKELYTHFLTGLRPQRSCIAFGSAKDSNSLIEAFDSCLAYAGVVPIGGQRQRTASLSVNQSFGFYECEFLLRFNRAFFAAPRSQAYTAKRFKAFTLLNSPIWKSRYPRIAIPYPLEWRPQIEQSASDHPLEIERIERDYGVKLFGPVERDARQRLDAIDWNHRPETSEADRQFFGATIATILQQE